MTHVIDSRGVWHRLDEIEFQRPGRHDSVELVQQSRRYLERQAQADIRSATQDSMSSLFVALIQGAAKKGASAVRADLLAEELKDAKATIDRLLAFVPGRMPTPDVERLRTISSELMQAAKDAFGPLGCKQYNVVALPEADDDCEAAVRIVLDVQLTPEAVAQFGEHAFAVHRRFVELTTPTERRAIHLSVGSISDPL